MPFFFLRSFSRNSLRLLIAAGLGVTSLMASTNFRWTQLPNLPDAEGFASSFAGVSHDTLLVAGGANFPGKRPWEGGTKVWYDEVFALTEPQGKWFKAGKLPRPIAYGVSLTTSRGIVCAGGGDAKEHFRSVFLLNWDGQKLRTENLPELPTPLAFGNGAVAGEKVFLVGGLAKPDATTAASVFLMLDLSHPAEGWHELPACPGAPRMLAQVGVIGETVYVCGGVALHAGAGGKAVRAYLRDAYAYDQPRGWRKLAEMPNGVAAAPSPMPATPSGELLVISGDDGTRAHLTGPNHPGFLQDIFAYDSTRNTWRKLADAPISRATAPTACWRGNWIVAGGERKPGYRSPEVWALEFKP
jgi:N-acetylneuraminic acid mutarotase